VPKCYTVSAASWTRLFSSRGGSKGGKGGTCPPKPQIIFYKRKYYFTSLRTLRCSFQKTRFISLYNIILPPNAMACVSIYSRLHSSCTTARSCWWKNKNDELMRWLWLWYCHKNKSIWTDIGQSIWTYLFPLRKWFFSLMPPESRLPPGLYSWTRWETSVPRLPASAPPKPKSWIHPCLAVIFVTKEFASSSAFARR